MLIEIFTPKWVITDQTEGGSTTSYNSGRRIGLLRAIANIWLQMPALMLTISALAILIFSAFILVDLQRVVNGGETNYVVATLSVYLSVYNVFSNLLAMLGIFGGNND